MPQLGMVLPSMGNRSNNQDREGRYCHKVFAHIIVLALCETLRYS